MKKTYNCPECGTILEFWFEFHYNCPKCGARFLILKDDQPDEKQRPITDFFS